MKKLLLAILLLLAPSVGWGQPNSNTMPPLCTSGTILTTCVPQVQGTRARISDATAVTDCAGGGAVEATCEYNGTAWLPLTSGTWVGANGDNIINSVNGIFDFTRDDAGSVRIICSDTDANCNITFDSGGAGSITIGSNDATSITMTTDGGSSTTIDGGVSVPGDITSANDSAVEGSGNNAQANNEFIGLPRLGAWSTGAGVNGTTNTIGPAVFIDETPAGEWTATANMTAATEATIYRWGTASLSIVVGATPADGNGADNPLGGGDQDWTADESFGLWHRCDATTTAGDWVIEITDSVAGATEVAIPALTAADTWVWTEVDVSGVADASKDVVTDLAFDVSAAGAAALAGVTCYFDYAVKWDGADEETLGIDILVDGLIASYAVVTATGGNRIPVLVVEGTDYIVHYETGNDAIVAITDQSANSLWGFAALE